MYLVGFPLLLIPVAIYNIVAFLMPDLRLAAPVARVVLPSGAEWAVSTADILVALGIVLLLVEAAKGVRPNGKYAADHLLSILLCAAVTAEFLLLPRFGDSNYFPFVVLTAVDVLTGLTLAVRLRAFRRRLVAPAAPAVPVASPEPAPVASDPVPPAETPAEPKF